MQTKITDYDFYKSASNLTTQHLGANIYEGIHILASLLDCTDKLVNPKRNVKNHPAAKLWVGYEKELFVYIKVHLREWIQVRGFKSYINLKNYRMLERFGKFNHYIKTPLWITDELIQTHRSVLIQKEIEKVDDLLYDLFLLIYNDNICSSEKIELQNKLYKKIEENNHYRKLWPDCPDNLQMKYTWRAE